MATQPAFWRILGRKPWKTTGLRCLAAGFSIIALAQPEAPGGPPVVFWASAPIAPAETLLLLGGDLGPETKIEIRRLADDNDADAVTPPDWASCPTIQPTANSAKIIVPDGLQQGVYAVRPQTREGAGDEFLVNAPDPWWFQGDEGSQASLGGWLRVFGTCLAFDRKASVALRQEDNAVRQLDVVNQSRWELRAQIPTDLPPGRYDVLVSNGFGGAASWRPAGAVEVIRPIAWKQNVFEVTPQANGNGDEKSIVAALQKASRNGGGIVLLRRGVYDMKGTITIPPRTVLKGEDRDGVSLQWPDFDKPPESLIVANDCGLEDLAIYCRRHATVVESGPTSQRFRMSRVRIRANAFFMHTQPDAVHRGRKAPGELGEGRVIRVVGKNFQITDCDLWGSGQVIAVDPHGFAGRQRPWYGAISGNRIAYGYQGHLFENVDRLIFEGNEVVGHGSTAGGNGISTYWNNFSKHVFYARNHTHDIYGIDREALTLDGDGGAYFGPVTADGDRLHLDADPVFHDYAPTPHTDYRGGGVYVLEGTGAGQYRFVTGHRGREWVVDRPWDVPLDESSVISIVPFRGRNIFAGNHIEDAGPLQLYGSAVDVIVADNVTTRADGLLAWGLSQHGWGWHPVFRCQFLGNTLEGGNGFGARIAGPASIGVATTGNNEQYTGPLARAMVIRRNTLDDQASILVDGNVADVIVEHNTINDSPLGVRIGGSVSGAVVRSNAFSAVPQPLTGDGASRAHTR